MTHRIELIVRLLTEDLRTGVWPDDVRKLKREWRDDPKQEHLFRAMCLIDSVVTYARGTDATGPAIIRKLGDVVARSEPAVADALDARNVRRARILAAVERGDRLALGLELSDQLSTDAPTDTIEQADERNTRIMEAIEQHLPSLGQNVKGTPTGAKMVAGRITMALNVFGDARRKPRSVRDAFHKALGTLRTTQT